MNTDNSELIEFDRHGGTFQETMHVIYYITGGCKFKCTYCDVVDNDRVNTDIDSQKLIVDTLMRIEKPFEIYLYGGEPTEYKFIHELIEYIIEKRSKYLTRIELQTNLNVNFNELSKFLSYDLVTISPSVHITFLKGDNIHDIFDKICLIDQSDKLERIDFMLEKWKKQQHIDLYNMLIEAGYGSKIIFVYNYYEPNRKDIYTGKWNSNCVEYDTIIKNHQSTQENYKLVYDNGETVYKNANQLVEEEMSFEGWLCDAKKNLVWVDYTGDWWECNTAQIKSPPRGNILTSSDIFLTETKYPVVCRIKKCDACFFVKKWRQN